VPAAMASIISSGVALEKRKEESKKKKKARGGGEGGGEKGKWCPCSGADLRSCFQDPSPGDEKGKKKRKKKHKTTNDGKGGGKKREKRMTGEKEEGKFAISSVLPTTRAGELKSIGAIL